VEGSHGAQPNFYVDSILRDSKLQKRLEKDAENIDTYIKTIPKVITV